MSQSAVAGKRVHASPHSPHSGGLVARSSQRSPPFLRSPQGSAADARPHLGWLAIQVGHDCAHTAHRRVLVLRQRRSPAGLCLAACGRSAPGRRRPGARAGARHPWARRRPRPSFSPGCHSPRPGRPDARHPCLTRPGRHARAARRSTWPVSPCGLAAGGGPGRTAGTRMLKLTCPTCRYTVRTTRKWLDVGQPFCPDGDPLVELAK